MALKGLGVQVDHLFACDVSPHAKATIMANFPPKVFYDDLTTRDNAQAARADLYVAGFPCQPFSRAGKQQGFDDELGRGTIFFKIREYIKAQVPKVFILENVSGLLRLEGGRYFAAIMKSLEALGKYNLHSRLLNTKEHGVPQNRGRVYIIGIEKTRDGGTFEWPQPVPQPSIELFLEPRKSKPTKLDLPPRKQGTARANVKAALVELKKKGHDPLNEPWVIDCDSTFRFMSYAKDVSLCLLCGRPKGHWVTNRGRRMTKAEMMRLQGMPTPDEGFVVDVSECQLGHQIGNAMSANVLERILVRLLPAAGLYPAKKLFDRWAPASGTAAPTTPVKRRVAPSLPRSPVKQKRTLRRTPSAAPPAKAARTGRA